MEGIEVVEDSDQWWTFVNTIMNLGVQWEVGHAFNNCSTLSFSIKTAAWVSLVVTKEPYVLCDCNCWVLKHAYPPGLFVYFSDHLTWSMDMRKLADARLTRPRTLKYHLLILILFCHLFCYFFMFHTQKKFSLFLLVYSIFSIRSTFPGHRNLLVSVFRKRCVSHVLFTFI